MIFLKHGGYDGYTERALPDLSMTYGLLSVIITPVCYCKCVSAIPGVSFLSLFIYFFIPRMI